jgi:hypothetical protein
MTKYTEKYDFVIIGGGIFGAYAALYLAKKKQKVCLIEKETELFTKASVVNQARLHSGYHYPRSVATALMSDDNKARFTQEHKDFINFQFEKYYAIDKFGSFTDSLQFQRFCEYIDIKCEKVKNHPLFNYHRIDTLYATTEYTFDPYLIANYYKQQLKDTPSIKVYKHSAVEAVEKKSDGWDLQVKHLANDEQKALTGIQVINATYAGSNAINQLFGLDNIELMHEISEMVFVSSPQLMNIGLTVMDGQFGSLMPYGLSGLLSLSSVAYTHHKVSYDNLPSFDCQQINMACKPNFTSNCNYCPAQPKSNYLKMFRQIQHYFSDEVSMQYFKSLFTIKSKLKANYIDDGRPTEISVLNENPRFYCIFAGKINSIYEIEKVVQF